MHQLWQLVRASTAVRTDFPPEVVTVGGHDFVFVDGALTIGCVPALGVVAAGPVKLPQERATRHVETVLEPNHTHFVIVPGKEWGAESPWIALTATVHAGTARCVTVLINGGQIVCRGRARR